MQERIFRSKFLIELLRKLSSLNVCLIYLSAKIYFDVTFC